MHIPPNTYINVEAYMHNIGYCGVIRKRSMTVLKVHVVTRLLLGHPEKLLSTPK